jgi:hypothetical protein
MKPGENMHFLGDSTALSVWNANGRHKIGRGPAIRSRNEYGAIRAEDIPNASLVRLVTSNICASEINAIDSLRNIYKIAYHQQLPQRTICYKTTDL